jgi:hypothetical protein
MAFNMDNTDVWEVEEVLDVELDVAPRLPTAWL